LDTKFKITELNAEHVRIKDRERVNLILGNLRQSGKRSLQVVSDFDRTISLVSFNGEPCPTSFGILEVSDHIDPEHRQALNDLFHHYFPIEHDHSMTKEEKLPFMIEWWEKAQQVIVDTGITRDDLRTIIQSSWTHLRRNCKTFFKALEDNDIPCLVFSAGLGDVIEEWMEHECSGSYKNIKIVSNFMDFDEEHSRIKGFKGSMIHIFNKNEGVLLDTDYEQTIHSRPNVTEFLFCCLYLTFYNS
jgi:HAD superfamily hydrolase (TIGR01544 family)